MPTTPTVVSMTLTRVCLWLSLQRHVYTTLENDPLFARQPGEDVSLETMRELTFRRVKQLFRYDFLTRDDIMQNPWKTVVLNDCLGSYDWSVGAKYFLNKGVSSRCHVGLTPLITRNITWVRVIS